jgi:hypothetical protein
LISRGSRFHASAVSFSLAARPTNRSSDHPGIFANCPMVRTPISGQPGLGDWTHPPHQFDGQVVKEVQLGIGLDDHQPIWLGHLRGNFRQMLGARHTDRNRKAKLRPYAGPDCPSNFGGRTKEMGAAGDVGKRLVDGNSLDQRREIIEHVDGGIAQPLIILEMAADKDELRTEFARLPSRHATANSEGRRIRASRNGGSSRVNDLQTTGRTFESFRARQRNQ